MRKQNVSNYKCLTVIVSLILVTVIGSVAFATHQSLRVRTSVYPAIVHGVGVVISNSHRHIRMNGGLDELSNLMDEFTVFVFNAPDGDYHHRAYGDVRDHLKEGDVVFVDSIRPLDEYARIDPTHLGNSYETNNCSFDKSDVLINPLTRVWQSK